MILEVIQPEKIPRVCCFYQLICIPCQHNFTIAALIHEFQSSLPCLAENSLALIPCDKQNIPLCHPCKLKLLLDHLRIQLNDKNAQNIIRIPSLQIIFSGHLHNICFSLLLDDQLPSLISICKSIYILRKFYPISVSPDPLFR